MAAMRRFFGPASRATSLCVATTLVLLTAFATPAPAETPPPPAASSPPTTPAPTGALEAGDTAAPGAPPAAVEPLGTPGTGAPLPAASASVTEGAYAPLSPAPRPRPFYQRAWFWGVCGVAIVTLTIIGVLSLQPIDPAQPNTRLGDMRAF
jgi:hypothetical protein